MYKKEYVQTFLEKQGQLFDEPVADDFEEAEAFLEDCMAVVLDSLKDVKKYLDGMGADVEGLSLKELEEESEVFQQFIRGEKDLQAIAEDKGIVYESAQQRIHRAKRKIKVQMVGFLDGNIGGM